MLIFRLFVNKSFFFTCLLFPGEVKGHPAPWRVWFFAVWSLWPEIGYFYRIFFSCQTEIVYGFCAVLAADVVFNRLVVFPATIL